MEQHGIPDQFIQDNHSYSQKGTLRGLHYQIAPKEQSKLVRVVSGSIFDVAVDIRKGSSTFGQWVGEVLSGENHRMLYTPSGFAHGFLTLSDNADVLYKVSNYFSKEHERGLRWNDPDIQIEWPKIEGEVLLSDKDQSASLLKEIE